jgi:hypothetical protein
VTRPSVLVISFSNLAIDPRVNRHIRFLRDDYRVTAAGFADPGIDGVRFLPLPPTVGTPSVAYRALTAIVALAGADTRRYWRSPQIADAARRLGGERADLWIANDLETLPLALRLAGDAPVIFDAHEYAPREYDGLGFRLLHGRYRRRLACRFVPRAARVLTVSPGLARAFASEIGVPPPPVIDNAADFQDLTPSPVGTSRLRLVHHGRTNPSRETERMIAAVAAVADRVELTLMLSNAAGDSYVAQLRRAADGVRNVQFRPPVPMRELPRALNAYDVGLYLLPPTNFNNRHALPNKLFEFVQGRLAVVVGPSPDMADVVRGYGVGAVAPEFTAESLSATLRSLTPEMVVAFKQAAHAAARDLSAEANRPRLLAFVAEAIARSAVGARRSL